MKTTYNVKEASEIMGVTPERTRQLVVSGNIPKAVYIEGTRKQYVIPKKPFLEWLGLTETEVQI